MSEWVSDKGKQWSDSGPIKKVYELFGGTITAKGHNVTRLSLWHTLPMHLIPLSLFQLLCWWTQCEMLLVRWGFWLESIPFIISLFYRTRVRSLVMLVTHSLTNWLTHWLPFSKLDSLTHWLLFSKLDWCDPGLWRYQLKTCWGCYCCWCWWLETFWRQFYAFFLEAEV